MSKAGRKPGKLPPRRGETMAEAEARRAAYRESYYKRREKALESHARRAKESPKRRATTAKNRKKYYIQVEKPIHKRVAQERRLHRYSIDLFNTDFKKSPKVLRVNNKITVCFDLSIIDNKVFRHFRLREKLRHEIFMGRFPRATFIANDGTFYFSREWIREFVRLYKKCKIDLKLSNPKVLKEILKGWSLPEEIPELDDYEYEVNILRPSVRGRYSYKQVLRFLERKRGTSTGNGYTKDYVRVRGADRRRGYSEC